MGREYLLPQPTRGSGAEPWPKTVLILFQHNKTHLVAMYFCSLVYMYRIAHAVILDVKAVFFTSRLTEMGACRFGTEINIFLVQYATIEN